MRVLIDVDGVLLKQNIYTPQADCLVQAVMEVRGPRAAMKIQTWDWVGRTDLDILKHGAGESRLEEAREEYQRLFRQACPQDLRREVSKDVQQAIWEAVDEMGFSFSPVTGNLEGIARRKLTRTRLDAYVNLDSGAYGEHGSRPDILRQALALAGDRHTVYVGDTWRDLAAARLAGVRFIGWETEKHRGELEAADWVARNCEELVSALGDAAWAGTVT
jgi:phosphoglycolate phosphatase-like HAD superfamily hydrolase